MRRSALPLLAALIVLPTEFLLAPASALASGAIRQKPPVARTETFDALRRRAEAARDAQRLEEAAALYTRAVLLRPAWTEGHWYLGTIQYERDRFADARDAFAVVVERQPENGVARAFKGLCEFQVGAHRAALDDLVRAHEIGLGADPNLGAVTRYHRAILLTRFGRFEQALRVLAGFARGDERSDVIDAMGLAALRMPRLPAEVPSDSRDLVRSAGRAAFLSAAADRQGARQAFDALAARYPRTPNVHYLRGLSLLRDDVDEARLEFERELEVSPDHAPAMVQIAQELLKRGDAAAAAPWAEKAAGLAADSFVARRTLGQVRLAQGLTSAAVAELEAAVRLEPTSPSVRFTLARAYQRAGRAKDAERERKEFARLEQIQRVERGGANAVGDPEAGEAAGPP